ncbi:MAG TPA: aspartate aminotransferase family protein [Burkholderiaceae bacterium]|nr:aspartate aminotransferase family protein [Burkholderiaceae bacterium]
MSDENPIVEAAKRVLMNNYRQSPVVMSRGFGCQLWDDQGHRYLDMTAGVAVCVLGHADPGLAHAIAEQASKLIHVSNLYYVENQVRLAEALVNRGFPGRAFFCNSGAEANEAALKLARRYQVTTSKRPQRIEIIAFENSFHGRTVGALSVTGQAKYRDGFGPLFGPVKFLPFGDVEAVRSAVTIETCAVIIEPVQAEGGIHLPPPGFLQELRRRCTETGTVLIFDEVQTGVGRTGSFYAFEKERVVPDIISLAKGLGGGVPIGAILANEEVSRGFEPGTHASTFGGNPFATAAALYVQDAIDRLGLLERCREAGAYLGNALTRLAERRRPRSRGARGRGLLQGLVLDSDATPVVTKARERGLLISAVGGNVVRLVPPLIVGKAEIDEAIEILEGVLSDV